MFLGYAWAVSCRPPLTAGVRCTKRQYFFLGIKFEVKTMIDVKQAVQVASDFIKQLYGADQLQQLTLEEVELTDDDRFWLVTLGFSRPELASPLEAFATAKQRREYKILKIHADSGKVQAMKIREVCKRSQGGSSATY